MKKLLLGAAFASFSMTGAAFANDTTVCLITKTDTNPFFVKMREGAAAKAEELGMTLKAFAGKIDGDHETQVQAIETCILDGAKGILITASDTSSIVPAVMQARDAGLLVIALDTPLTPIDAADATFATEVKNADMPVLVDFWAEWCGPCKQIGRALEELSDEMAGKVKIVKVNVDENPNSPAQMGVRGIPALFIFKDGQVVSNMAGAKPKAALQSWIEESI